MSTLQPAARSSSRVSTTLRFDTLSITLHWLTALSVLAAFVLGPGDFGSFVRANGHPAERPDIVAHETLGVTVLLLTLVRLLWIAIRPGAPEQPIAPWMRIASKLVQAALLALCLLLPFTAVLALIRQSQAVTLLGGVQLDPAALTFLHSIASSVRWGGIHGLLGVVLIWLAAGHAGAALMHRYVFHDGVLQSMLPWRSKG